MDPRDIEKIIESAPNATAFFVFEAHRLASFTNWPFDETAQCTKLKVSKITFFFF